MHRWSIAPLVISLVAGCSDLPDTVSSPDGGHALNGSGSGTGGDSTSDPNVGSGGSDVGSGGSAIGSGGSDLGSGGSSGPGTGGSAGSAGALGTGGNGGATGTGGTMMQPDAGTTGGPGPMAILDNQQWLLPCGKNQSYSDLVCVNQIGNGCNGTNPYLTRGTINRDQTIAVGGNAATTYQVTLRFRGVVEPKTYQGGTKPNPTVKTDGWYVGGQPAQNNNYNVYMFSVSSPKQDYWLNALGNQMPTVPEAHFSYPIDYTVTVPVSGGAMIRMLADDSNCSAIKNCDSTSHDASGGAGICNPITVPNLTTTPNIAQPYNGQFIVMNVVSVK